MMDPEQLKTLLNTLSSFPFTLLIGAIAMVAIYYLWHGSVRFMKWGLDTTMKWWSQTGTKTKRLILSVPVLSIFILFHLFCLTDVAKFYLAVLQVVLSCLAVVVFLACLGFGIDQLEKRGLIKSVDKVIETIGALLLIMLGLSTLLLAAWGVGWLLNQLIQIVVSSTL